MVCLMKYLRIWTEDFYLGPLEDRWNVIRDVVHADAVVHLHPACNSGCTNIILDTSQVGRRAACRIRDLTVHTVCLGKEIRARKWNKWNFCLPKLNKHPVAGTSLRSCWPLSWSRYVPLCLQSERFIYVFPRTRHFFQWRHSALPPNTFQRPF